MHFMSNQKITNVNDTHNLNMYFDNNKYKLYYIQINGHDTLANKESVIPIHWSHSALTYLKSLKLDDTVSMSIRGECITGTITNNGLKYSCRNSDIDILLW